MLDFPTLDRFVEEIRSNRYDVVGISSIIPNMLKVKKMCELIRQYQPGAKIVVGGHLANVPDLDRRIDADHIVKGEGIEWFRRYLGEQTDRSIRHPVIASAIGTRNMGITVRERRDDVAATLIPSAGWTYEPPTFYEKNDACEDLAGAKRCRHVTPHVDWTAVKAALPEAQTDPTALAAV